MSSRQLRYYLSICECGSASVKGNKSRTNKAKRDFQCSLKWFAIMGKALLQAPNTAANNNKNPGKRPFVNGQLIIDLFFSLLLKGNSTNSQWAPNQSCEPHAQEVAWFEGVWYEQCRVCSFSQKVASVKFDLPQYWSGTLVIMWVIKFYYSTGASVIYCGCCLLSNLLSWCQKWQRNWSIGFWRLGNNSLVVSGSLGKYERAPEPTWAAWNQEKYPRPSKIITDTAWI